MQDLNVLSMTIKVTLVLTILHTTRTLKKSRGVIIRRVWDGN